MKTRAIAAVCLTMLMGACLTELPDTVIDVVKELNLRVDSLSHHSYNRVSIIASASNSAHVLELGVEVNGDKVKSSSLSSFDSTLQVNLRGTGDTLRVRAYAVVGKGTVFSQPKKLAGKSYLPIVDSLRNTSQTNSTLVMSAVVTNDNGLPTARGFCWGTSNNPTVSGNKIAVDSGVGAFSDTIKGLSAGATYYVRAYAANAAGTSYTVSGSYTMGGVPVTGVTLSQAAAALTVGGTLTLTPTVQPSNATNKNVTWTSSNTAIATVSNGLVTAIAQGSATITVATQDGNKTAVCAVTVNPGSTAFTLGTVTFATAQTWTIGAQMWSDAVQATGCNKIAFDGNNPDCRSNPDYKGDLFSWYAVDSYKSQLCPSGWRVPTRQDFIDLDIALGGTGNNRNSDVTTVAKYLNTWDGVYGGACIADGALDNQGLTAYYWSQLENGTNNAYSLAYSSGGSIYPQNYNYKLYGFTLRCVQENTAFVAVTGVTLSQATATLAAGSSLTLTATVQPSNATNKNVSWTSSNTAVATVSNGVVTAKAIGTTTITVTTQNGNKTATCAVKVVPNGSLVLGDIAWAAANVDSYQQFASRPDMYTKFYQWNRTTAWAATGSVSGWNSSYDNSPTWTNPCPNGWRLPTHTEFIELHNAGSTWAAANARGNAVNGRFYGTNHASCTLPNNMNNCIFLSAGGGRNTNGSLSNQTSHGYYWSSTQTAASSGYGLYFLNNSSNPSYDNAKASALNIRCVQ